MLFYRTYTVARSLIQFNIKWNVRCSYNSKIDATAQLLHSQRLLFRPFKVYTVHSDVVHILQLCCYYCYHFILFCLSLYRSGNSSICIDSYGALCVGDRVREKAEKPNRHMRYDDVSEQKHIFLINVH